MSPVEDLEVSDQPFDRLTVLCQTMTDALDQAVLEERRDLAIRDIGEIDAEKIKAEAPEVRGIVFLSDADRSGIQMFGYDSSAEGMADLLVHMKAVFQSMGKDFGVMTDQGVMLMEER
jgi:hypothetical protein